jgi:ABC-2 type transport system ATP-binding protein
MSEGIIHTEGLTKSYGKNRGVIDVSLDVRPGEVFGFLGPNGAGKTTTIRTLLDFIRPNSGVAKVFGMDAHRQSRDIRRRIGYLPGDLALYENLKGADMLRYMGNLRGGVEWNDVQQLAERLHSDLSRPIRTLSQGNRQKIGLIQALMHKPELLILDEPTNGLDPLIQQVFYRLISEVEEQTVFLSSHNLPEVERVCDRVGIIREGRLIAVEEVSALKSRALRQLEIHFAAPVPESAFANVAGVSDLAVEQNVLRCSVKGTLDAVIKAASKFEVVNVVSHEPSLEEIFLAYYNRGENNAA